jgi:hypothetical protein
VAVYVMAFVFRLSDEQARTNIEDTVEESRVEEKELGGPSA